MNLPSFALKYPAIVIAATSIMVFGGIIALVTMPRQEDPEIEIRACVVTTAWPGATAEMVEQLITDPIETAVDTIDEVESINSITTAGHSAVFVRLKDEITSADQIWDKVCP